MTKEYPWGKGTPKWVRDTDANDSNKTVYTVPAGKKAKITHLEARLQATATVGNRVFQIVIANSVGTVYMCKGPAVQTASQDRWYFAGNVSPGTAFVGESTSHGFVYLPPDLILDAGSTVQVWDAAAIDAAADDLTVYMQYVEFDA